MGYHHGCLTRMKGPPLSLAYVVCELPVYQVKGYKTGSCRQGGHCSTVQHCTIPLPIAPKCTQHYSSGELSNLEEYCWSSKYFVYGYHWRHHKSVLKGEQLTLISRQTCCVIAKEIPQLFAEMIPALYGLSDRHINWFSTTLICTILVWHITTNLLGFQSYNFYIKKIYI